MLDIGVYTVTGAASGYRSIDIYRMNLSRLSDIDLFVRESAPYHHNDIPIMVVDRAADRVKVFIGDNFYMATCLEYHHEGYRNFRIFSYYDRVPKINDVYDFNYLLRQMRMIKQTDSIY